MSKLKPIKFIHAKTPYMKGEIAGFTEKEAESLINRGYAIPVTSVRNRDAEALKNISNAPETKHIAGPMERKCGKCGKPGHTKTSCPKK